jgi:hypothetical protein
MSRDRTTITRAEAIRRRHDEEERRRTDLAKKRVSIPRPKVEKKSARAESAIPTRRLRQRYDIAFSHPQGRAYTQAPAISLPKLDLSFGPRWFSALLLAGCLAMLYLMWSVDPFIVRGVTLLGNQRVNGQEIEMVLGVMNQPAALLNLAQIEYNVLSAFPEFSSVEVTVALPAEVTILVTERQPVLAWSQDGQVVWVDATGHAFAPRGQVEGLVTILAVGAPPVPAVDLNQVIGARPFMAAELTQAARALSQALPEGSALIYDPRYGLGWADVRGWQAFFGQTYTDMPVKLNVYQSLVAYLEQRGVQPSLISVEYPDAPFYRLAQE